MGKRRDKREYEITISEVAKKDFVFHYKSGNKLSKKNLEIFFEELRFTPTLGKGKPHALSHNLKGFWSRSINSKDRLIYTIDEENKVVDIISAKGHYGDT